jgi:hypothetical protein
MARMATLLRLGTRSLGHAQRRALASFRYAVPAASKVRRVTVTNEPDMTDCTATLPRKRMGARALFFDAADRVLLAEPTYKPYWEIPGGAVEAGESPRDAVAREPKEEVGLSCPNRRDASDRLGFRPSWMPSA